MDLRLFNDRSLTTQFVWTGLCAAVAASGVAWLVFARSWQLPLAVFGGGAVATLAAAVLAARASRALDRIGAAAGVLVRDDAPNDASIDVDHSSADLRRATSRLRHLVEVFRERREALLALNRAMRQRLDHRTHELTTLENLSTGLAMKSDLHELIDEALGALEQTLQYSTASIWARASREAGGQVVLQGYRTAERVEAEQDAPDLRGMRLSRANLQRYEEIERDGQPIVENRARQSLLSWLWSKVVDDSRTSALYRGTRSWMAVPMKFRHAVLAVLRVDHHEYDYFDAERVRLLNAVASQAALAMRHAQLLEREREVAIVAERNRIARDLHDAVSQTLFAANVIAGTLAGALARGPAPDAAALKAQAETLERLSRGALAEMRLLMFELRPDALEHAMLADLLKLAVEALACRGDITVEQTLSRDDALSPVVRVQLYRIAQEALSNVVRHSGASRVVVEWTVHSPRRATLRIADNGKGLDPEVRAPGHFGLENMRSRAAEIGAELELVSAPGQGTEWVVNVA